MARPLRNSRETKKRYPDSHRSTVTTQTDVFFYYSNKKGESKRLANNMKNTFESKYDKHQPNRGFSGTVSGRNLYVLSHTTAINMNKNRPAIRVVLTVFPVKSVYFITALL